MVFNLLEPKNMNQPSVSLRPVSECQCPDITVLPLVFKTWQIRGLPTVHCEVKVVSVLCIMFNLRPVVTTLTGLLEGWQCVHVSVCLPCFTLTSSTMLWFQGRVQNQAIPVQQKKKNRDVLSNIVTCYTCGTNVLSQLLHRYTIF